jgi:hypothetical protein
VLFERAEVLACAGELAAEDGLGRRQAAGDVALEDVVQALALGQNAEAPLERRFRQPPHGRRA